MTVRTLPKLLQVGELVSQRLKEARLNFYIPRNILEMMRFRRATHMTADILAAFLLLIICDFEVEVGERRLQI
jgi:hypothetical protein